MRISYDKESGAFTIYLREGKPDHAEDISKEADVYVDVDAEGRVLSIEALSFEDLRMALEECGGNLEIPERIGASRLRRQGATVASIHELPGRRFSEVRIQERGVGWTGASLSKLLLSGKAAGSSVG